MIELGLRYDLDRAVKRWTDVRGGPLLVLQTAGDNLEQTGLALLREYSGSGGMPLSLVKQLMRAMTAWCSDRRLPQMVMRAGDTLANALNSVRSWDDVLSDVSAELTVQLPSEEGPRHDRDERRG